MREGMLDEPTGEDVGFFRVEGGVEFGFGGANIDGETSLI